MPKMFTPADLKHFRYVSWPVLSPDEGRIAYVVKTADEPTGLFIPQLRLLDVATRSDRLLLEHTDSPVFLPDGRIACLHSGDGEKQLCIVDPESGDCRQVTHLRHGVTRFTLSDDGRKAAFEALLWPEEVENGTALTEMSPEEKAAWEKEIDMRPWCVTELVYKMDEWYGMRKGEYEHIGVADLATGETSILDTDMAGIYPAMAPDGSAVAYYGYPYHDANGHQVELMLFDLASGTQKQVSQDLYIAKDHAPIFTADGALITMAYLPIPDGGTTMGPYRVPLNGGEATPMLDGEDESLTHGVNPLITGRTENGGGMAYAYLRGAYLYFLGARDGRTCVCRLPAAGGRVEMVQPGRTDVQCFHVGETGRLVCVMGEMQRPGEIWLDGCTLTDHNAWLREYAQGQITECWTQSRDGKARLHYFLLRPVGAEEGKRYPAVLDIHGGPQCMYASAYWHEFHALSAKGFAVIYGDPRGSVGYGHAHCAGPVCWMPEAMNDMEDILADAIARGGIDPERVGVTGGSYGGYMTNKLIGRTKHFAAAVTQRSLINPATSYGTGDIGFISGRGAPPADFRMLDYLVDRAKGNLITYIDNIDIPVLILHAFKDYRCSFEQGEQFFIAMKERHPEIPVRLVMFPEENHALTRTGKLHSQIRHLQELVGWFASHLQKEAK